MKKNNFILLIIGITLVLMSCSKDNKVPCFTTTKSAFDVDEAVVFTNCTKEAEKYLWQFGDGTTSEEVSPSHAYKRAGIYNISLSIVSPGSMQPQVYTNSILISNQSLKFDNLTVGTRVRTKTYPEGFKGNDTTTVDSTYGVNFNLTTFEENSTKVKFFISAEKTAIGSLPIVADVANNQIVVPETSKSENLGGGNTAKLTLKDFIAKYDNGKVDISFTVIEILTTGANTKTYTTKYSYSFFK